MEMQRISIGAQVGERVIVHQNGRGEPTLIGKVHHIEDTHQPHISKGLVHAVTSVYYIVEESRRSQDIGLLWREDFDKA